MIQDSKSIKGRALHSNPFSPLHHKWSLCFQEVVTRSTSPSMDSAYLKNCLQEVVMQSTSPSVESVYLKNLVVTGQGSTSVTSQQYRRETENTPLSQCQIFWTFLADRWQSNQPPREDLQSNPINRKHTSESLRFLQSPNSKRNS